MKKNIEEQTVNSLRYLAITAITNAKSGHPGMALGACPIMYSLYANAMKCSSKYPDYFNRDRFVLCAGHASTLQYTILHAMGYDYTIEDLKSVRQMGAKCKGHPRFNTELGIDATSGPLGQGIPTGVGMAIAETMLAARFNKKDAEIINHHTFVLASDGGLMEGVTNEASSLAGTLKLSKLIVLYDSNQITMESSTDVSFTENVLLRYKALGWNTIEVEDGNNVSDITKAINAAKLQNEKPTIIKINTRIGFASPQENTIQAHGNPLSAEELKLTKDALGVTDEYFKLNDAVQKHLKLKIQDNARILEKEYKIFDVYKTKYPEEFEEFKKWMNDDYSKNLDWSTIGVDLKDEATRKSSAKILNQISQKVPNLVSGSADVAFSVGTNIINGGSYSPSNRKGRNIHFGVREHSMAAICNGIALHGGLKILCSTFMVFSDYMRHAIRMSAQMSLPIIFVFSHDSLAIGQDGATHQPVEYNTMFRATPNINFIRPADAKETFFGYKTAMTSSKPSILCLSRQNVSSLKNTGKGAEKGGYSVGEEFTNPDLILIGTGSEVMLCESAALELSKFSIKTKVVSMPCVNIFENQTNTYKEKVLPSNIRKRLVVEAGSTLGWYKYAGLDGKVIGIDEFGQTGDGLKLMEYYGFSVKNIVKEAVKLLKNSQN